MNVLAAAIKVVSFDVPSRSFFCPLGCFSSERNNQPRNVLKTGAYLQHLSGLVAQYYLTMPLPNAQQGPYSLKPTFHPPCRPTSSQPELHWNANLLCNNWDGTAAFPHANLNIYTVMGAVSEDEAPTRFFPIFSNVVQLRTRRHAAVCINPRQSKQSLDDDDQCHKAIVSSCSCHRGVDLFHVSCYPLW